MKIVYFSNSILPSRKANSVHVMQMANAFKELGHDINLYGEIDANIQKYEDICHSYGVNNKIILSPYPRFLKNRFTTISKFFGVLKLFILKPDLVVGRNVKSCAYSSLMNFPTLLELHQPISWYPKPEQFFVWKYIRGRGFRGIITISEKLKDILLDETNLNSAKILVAHDAANSKDQINVKNKINNRLKIGYVGHLYEGRGIELICEMANKIPEHDFYVVGGEEEDIKMWKERSNQLKNLFFYGFIPHSEVSAFHQSCDVLLAPYQLKVTVPGGKCTQSFMSPLKIFEYMSSGVPFIVSDIPILREVLSNNVNCLMVNPVNLDDWIIAIKKLQNNEMRLTLASRARTDFEQKYTWKSRVKNIIEFSNIND